MIKAGKERYALNTSKYIGKGELQVLLGGILWGTIGLFIWLMKAQGACAEWISFLRMAFACLIMLAVTLARLGPAALRIPKRSMLACALLGLICHGIYNIFYSFAVTLAGVAISAVLLNIAPLFTALFSVLLFRERLSRLKLLALIINVAGCILAATGGQVDLAGISALGLLCGVAAGLCYAMTAILGRIAGNTTDVFVMSTWSYGWAALFLLLWVLIRGSELLLTAPVLGLGFAYALLPTALAYILYYRGVNAVKSVSSVPVLASLESVTAVLIGVLLLKEQIGIVHVAGMVLVLFSLPLMNRQPASSTTA